MLKTIFCVSLALVGLTVYAQQNDPPQRSSTSPRTANVTTGTVKSFEAGKSIEIDSKGQSQKFDLANADTTYTISPAVKIGSQVSVMETTDPATGKKMVNIEPAGKTGTSTSTDRKE